MEEVLGQTDSSWFSKVAGAQGPRPEQLMPQERGGWGLGLSSLPRKIRKDTWESGKKQKQKNCYSGLSPSLSIVSACPMASRDRHSGSPCWCDLQTLPTAESWSSNTVLCVNYLSKPGGGGNAEGWNSLWTVVLRWSKQDSYMQILQGAAWPALQCPWGYEGDGGSFWDIPCGCIVVIPHPPQLPVWCISEEIPYP